MGALSYYFFGLPLRPIMKQHRFIAFSFSVAITFLFFADSGFAQWSKILTLRGAFSGFFFNELEGFIGSSDADGIVKTTDGGITWVHGNIPTGYNGGQITQIFMTDLLHGWATIEDFGTLNCILRTTDGGLNWLKTGPTGSYNNIYETPSAAIALSRNNQSGPPRYPTIKSTDGGLTFTSTGLILKNGIDFVDNLNGVMTSFSDAGTTVWMKTGDGGVTWTQINPLIHLEAWSIYGAKGTSVFYTAAEDDPNARTLPTRVMRSSDYGASWTTVNSLKFYTTGHIAGLGESPLYVQADIDASVNPPALGFSGMYRSTDKGLSWQSVGGPSHDRDTRFIVTGCNGGVVYAFDKKGNVWKTRNGGDGQIYEPPIKAQIYGDPIIFSGPICAISNAAIVIENLYCTDDTIVSAQILDTNSALFKSGALTITVMPSFPLFLAPNTKDSIRFTWQPFKIFHCDTTVTIQVKVKYYSKILQQTFDTTVTIFVHAVGEVPNATVVPTNLNFGNIPFCTVPDTPFVIRNLGCDTLFLLSAIGTAPVHYKILDANGIPLQLPVKIAPSDSDKIIIRLTLDSAGNYSSDLDLKLRHQGIIKDTLIHIAGVISAKSSFIVADSIDFGVVSTCRTVDSLLQIKNLGCNVPITITSAVLSNNTVFTLIGAPPYISPIAADSIGNVHLKFSPNRQQGEVDTLTLVFYALGEKQIRKIVIRGTGVLNIPKFVTSLLSDTLFELKMTPCDSPKVLPVILTNPGCKNITIKTAQLQGIPTPDISLSFGSIIPKDISDTASTNFRITVAPIALGTFSGFLHITYLIVGDNTIHDTLISYFLTVKHGPRILSLDHDSIYLGTFKLCDVRDSAVTIKNPGCDLLDILGVQIKGQGNFSLTSKTIVTPLSQNQSERIAFHFSPTQSGFITGTLTITSVSDTLPRRTVTITANIIPTDTMTFSILPTRSTFFAGDTLSVSMIPQQNVHGKGLYTLQFTLNYNGDLLTFLPSGNGVEILTPNVSSSGPTMGGTPKHTTAVFTLIGNPSIEFDSLTPAIKFHFSTALTDSISTIFKLTNISLNGGDSIYSRCELGILSASLPYTLSLRCGDSTLVKFLQLGSKLNIFADAVYPNPLTEQNNFQGRIPFRTSGGLIGMKVFDQLGRMITSKELLTESSGAYEFTIDGRNLSAGCYTYLLQEISNSSSSVRGRFIITK